MSGGGSTLLAHLETRRHQLRNPEGRALGWFLSCKWLYDPPLSRTACYLLPTLLSHPWGLSLGYPLVGVWLSNLSDRLCLFLPIEVTSVFFSDPPVRHWFSLLLLFSSFHFFCFPQYCLTPCVYLFGSDSVCNSLSLMFHLPVQICLLSFTISSSILTHISLSFFSLSLSLLFSLFFLLPLPLLLLLPLLSHFCPPFLSATIFYISLPLSLFVFLSVSHSLFPYLCDSVLISLYLYLSLN